MLLFARILTAQIRIAQLKLCYWRENKKPRSIKLGRNSVLLVLLSRLRVLRRIFGPKRDEVTGEWRKLHNEELHNLYSSPDIISE